MKEKYVCPFCGIASYLNEETFSKSACYFRTTGSRESFSIHEPVVTVIMKRCPNCEKHSYFIFGERFCFSYPPNSAIPFPDYIPKPITDDYIEAVSIVDLSPKASATLARRCLQGMIHDFWHIKEKNLNAEITALKGKVSQSQWSAIDGLRKIGNIGAHMESDIDRIIDVDPNEAKQLLKLIELLVEKWYIARNDEEQLLKNILDIADEKEVARKSDPSS